MISHIVSSHSLTSQWISTVSFSTWPAIARLIGDHLWQSTLFAAFAGLLTLAFRKNHAQVRNSLWFAASLKFLTPFVALVAIGSHFGALRVTPLAQNPTSFVFDMDTMSQPFSHLAPTAPAKNSHNLAYAIPITVLAIWLCGFATILLTWWANWRRISTVIRNASSIEQGPELNALRHLESAVGIARPLRFLSSNASLEPGVFGIANPVLLWPRNISERLDDKQIEMILAHELSHVRRRDNLAAAIHMIVEALFWFHPLVWWIGARMVDERERACDEDVLRLGGDPQVYAESILKVCEFYLESPLACMSGVTGSNLKKRMERIMSNHVGETLSRARKLALATAAVAALTVPITVGVLVAPRLLAQSSGVPAWQAAAGGKMSFDVASVKPTQKVGRPTSNITLLGDAYAPTGGLFSVTNLTLGNYLRFAFKDIKLAYQAAPDLSGVPSWVRADQYDIQARTHGNPTKDQMRLMVQSVLVDRFKLAFHYETRQIPVYALMLSKEGKLGPQLKPDNEPCSTTPADIQALNTAPQLPPPASSAAAASQIPKMPCGFPNPVPPSAPGRMRIAGTKIPLALLAEMYGTVPVTGLNRPVIDRTGLTGTFDVNFEFVPTLNGPPPPGFTPDPDGLTFAEALQDQLGLKVESTTGPVELLVIDHVEQPSPN